MNNKKKSISVTGIKERITKSSYDTILEGDRMDLGDDCYAWVYMLMKKKSKYSQWSGGGVKSIKLQIERK